MQDLRSKPFERMVVLGESHVAGACASREENRWVNIVCDLLSRFQGTPVALYNRGIGWP